MHPAFARRNHHQQTQKRNCQSQKGASTAGIPEQETPMDSHHSFLGGTGNCTDTQLKNTNDNPTFLKFIHEMLPVGHTLNRRDPSTYSEICSSCKHINETVETTIHMHECPSPSRTKWRRVFQQQIRVSLMQQHTRDDLLDFMLRCLTTVIDKAPPPTTEETPPQFHQVLKEQTLIGWPQLLHGRWSKQWQQLHLQSHTTPPNSKQKPAQWSKAILKTMWQQWHDMLVGWLVG